MKLVNFLIVKKALLIILFFILNILFTSGCVATLSVNKYVGYEPSIPSTELYGRPNKMEIIAEYNGQEQVKNVNYARITMKEARDACGYNKPVEILIPLEINSNLTPIIREAIIRETTISKPAKIFINSSLVRIRENFWKRTDIWNGYPNSIIIGYTDSMSLYDIEGNIQKNKELYVSYQNGPDNKDIRIDVKADTSGLEWICRTKGSKVIAYILMPFAFVVDVVTAPIQGIIMLSVLLTNPI